MSITITIQKDIIEPYPELEYQLFYMSVKEKEQDQFYIYTPKGYYREITELLDLYRLPYTLQSSLNILLLHIFIIEKEQELAEALQEQLARWGFGTVTLASDYHNWEEIHWRKHFSLALIDDDTLQLMSFFQRVHVLLHGITRPLILLTGKKGPQKLAFRSGIWTKVTRTMMLSKPFSALQLREAIERILEVIV